jgi:hypothetical protein
MTRFFYSTTFALATIIAVAWSSSAQAVTWTSSLSGTGQPAFPTDPGTGLGNWNAIYAQGFSAGTNTAIGGVSANTGITSGSTVYLNQFEFWRSGRTSVNDDGTGGTLPTPTNVQLAIVNNFFVDLSTLTTTSSALVGLSTNTIASIPVSSASSGEPLTFSFNSLPITYGPASDFNPAEDYAAIFVNVNGTTITPVKVPAIIVNYAPDPNNPSNYIPAHDYGDATQDYYNAVSNYVNGNYLATFNGYYADADFLASFTNTLPLHGDINNDGHFDAADITALEKALANPSSSSLSQSDLLSRGDFNGDGKLTNADLQGMLVALDSGQGSLSSTPEPSAFVLSALAGVALLLQGRRRRNLRHGVTQGA